ncbi:MAG: NAD(P)H-dependent glycerol-3-phosphate dehydrogenase [Pseudomonadales bacterium]|nr:NAD(P)H-dependent glycerol-3-phosphate dehydrogenase [Pseudomonadales bacterium]
MEVAILGGGNFGTAIANIVARNGFVTHLWMRDARQVADCLEFGENRRYLPGHPLDPLVRPTTDLADALARSGVVFVSVPSGSFREISARTAELASPDTVVISATKGIESDGFRLMSQVLEDYFPRERIGALSGPNLAEEIADGHYTGTVVASWAGAVTESVQQVLRSPTFRVYASADVYGVELAGALKNIYAIVCGMAAGLAVGQNTVGMLITRSLAEMSRLAVSLGANPFTFLGLAGVGDLLVTCTSPLSRNYQLGYRLAQGLSLEAAIEDLGKLAEGVNTLRAVHRRSSELGVYMPLASGLHRFMFEGAELGQVIVELMTGGQAVDVEFAHGPAAVAAPVEAN